MDCFRMLLEMVDDPTYVRHPPTLFYGTVTGWNCSQEYAEAGWELFKRLRRRVSNKEIQAEHTARKQKGSV